ncbi:MAG: hypothetical protein P8076_15740, partial [Gammaproteobacteria bacterium]
MNAGVVRRAALWCGILVALAIASRATASPAAHEREVFEKLVAIAESQGRHGAPGDDDRVPTFFITFPAHSRPPSFFLSSRDLLIMPKDSVRAIGRHWSVPILVVPSLKAIEARISGAISYDDALTELANFPSGNIQALVVETIKTAPNLAIKVNAMLSLRRVDLKKSTTRYLADQLKGSNTALRRAALLALQPYALGEDLS